MTDSTNVQNTFFCRTCNKDMPDFVTADKHFRDGHFIRTLIEIRMIIDGMPRGMPFFEWRVRP